jgi:hypothetical protein
MYERIVSITGMPRSGTSWIGMIFDSCPLVRYRLSPLFSYEYKNRVDESSSRQDWECVLRGAYGSGSVFMNQTERRQSGEYPLFPDKAEPAPVLVLKFNRFQNLVEPFLELFPEMRMLVVVRHPCGAIHSWLTAPKEFPPSADPMEHWRSGAIKKTGYGDFFGFEDWKRATRLHVRLARERPKQVRLARYEDIVRAPADRVHEMFRFFGLPFTAQTEAFLDRSRREHVPGPYSVFKPPAVIDRWRHELQPSIRDEILAELSGTDLAEFIA